MTDHRSEARANADMLDAIPDHPDDQWLNQGRGKYGTPPAAWQDWAAFIIAVLAVAACVAVGNVSGGVEAVKPAILLALLLPALSHACITGDRYSTAKALHLVGNAGIVYGVDMAVRAEAPAVFQRYPYLGLLPAVVASVGREVYKTNHPGYSCEWSSMAYDAAGMAVGAAGTRWLLVPRDKGVLVAYSRAF